MAIARIEQVQSRVQAVGTEGQQQIRHRLQLHTQSSFERTSSVSFGDGSRIDLPQASAEQMAQLASAYNALSPEGQASLESVSASYAQAIGTELHSNPAALEGRYSAAFTTATDQSIENFSATTGISDQSQAYQTIMLGAITCIEGDLADMAGELQTRNQLSTEARTDMTELRDALVDWPDDGSTQEFSWTEVKFDSEGGYQVIPHENEPLTKDEATALLSNLEEQKASIGDMTEMMKYDLQTKMQDYQQALNVLSNIMKQQHDTMMNTLRNIKA